MSLPEVLFILREDRRRESTKALLALQTEAQESVSTDDLSSVFSGWGVSVNRIVDMPMAFEWPMPASVF